MPPISSLIRAASSHQRGTILAGAVVATLLIGGFAPAGAPAQSPGTLTLTAPASSQIAETGGSTTVQVTRTSGSSGSVGATIDIAGTAGAGERTVSPTMVSFANGDTAPKTVTVTAIGDSVADGNKTVILSLSSPTGGVALDPGTQTVTIIDTPPQSQPQPPASPTQSIATGQRATALKKCKKKKKTARARRKCRKKAKLLPL